VKVHVTLWRWACRPSSGGHRSDSCCRSAVSQMSHKRKADGPATSEDNGHASGTKSPQKKLHTDAKANNNSSASAASAASAASSSASALPPSPSLTGAKKPVRVW
jgi:hypothetical protein